LSIKSGLWLSAFLSGYWAVYDVIWLLYDVALFTLFSLDVFEAFTYVVEKHDLRDHPGIKAIIMIGGLIADAACDEKLDGLYYISY